MTTETFKRGTLCLRCGTVREFEKKYKYGCAVYGTSYAQHIWNKEEVGCEVQALNKVDTNL